MSLIAAASISHCDLASIKGGRAVHDILSRRAVEIMAAAATMGPESDKLLDALVEEDASLTVVVGDVGLPGVGKMGARSLAKRIGPDEFRSLGWDYMDIPFDACRKQTVTVDFIANRDHRISRLSFTFENARLVAAEGWQHSFVSGAFPAADFKQADR